MWLVGIGVISGPASLCQILLVLILLDDSLSGLGYFPHMHVLISLQLNAKGNLSRYL